MEELFDIQSTEESNVEQEFNFDFSKENVDFNLSTEAVTNLSNDYSFALDGIVSPSDISESILAGKDEAIRREVSFEQYNQEKQDKTDLIGQLINRVSSETGVVSDEDVKIVAELSKEPEVPDPETVMEDMYARRAMNLAVALTSKGQDLTDVDLDSLDLGQKYIATNRVLGGVKSRLQAKYDNISWGQWGFEFLSQAIPGSFLWNTMGRIEEAPTSSIIPGTNIQQQAEYIYSKNPSEAKQIFQKAVDDIADHNVSAALEYADFIVGYTQSNNFIANAFGVLDVGPLAGGALLRGTKAASSLSKNTVVAMTKSGIDIPKAMDAVGKVKEAAKNRILNRVTPDETDITNPLEGVAESISELVKQTPTLANPYAAVGAADNLPFSSEFLSRLTTTMGQRTNTILSTLSDFVKIDRLGDDALEAGIDETSDLLKFQYNDLSDHFITTKWANDVDTALNLDKVELTLGRVDATPFSTIREANEHAKQFNLKPEEYEVKGLGNDFVISISKTIDEKTDKVRDAISISVQDTTPSSVTNQMFGRIRSSEYTMPVTLQTEGKVALLGASKVNNLLKDMARQLSGASKDLKSFLNSEKLRIDEVTNEIGRYSETVGDLVKNWQSKFGTVPTEKDVANYFTYVEYNDIDWVLRNLSIYKEKSIDGREMFDLPIKGVVFKKPMFEGKLVREFADDNVGAVLWDQEPALMQVIQTKRGQGAVRDGILRDIESGKLKIIDLSNEGRKNLQLFNGVKSIVEDKYIRYVLVKGNPRSSPLDFKQIPRKAGGHVKYEEGHYVRAPLFRTNEGSLPVYTGDFTLFHTASKNLGEEFAKDWNVARQALNQGDEALAKSLVNKNLDNILSWEEFTALYRGPNAEIPLDMPLVLTRTGQSTEDVLDTLGLHGKYLRSRDDPHNSDIGKINLQFAQERNAPISSLEHAGRDSNAKFRRGTGSTVDALATTDRALSQLIRNRYFEDFKTKAVEHFLGEFKDLFDVTDINDLYRNPFEFLSDPKWKKNANLERLAAAKNFRRTVLESLGTKSDFDKKMDTIKDKISEGIYDYTGVQTTQWKSIKPTDKIRSLMFHKTLGMFNPVQLFQQAQSAVHSFALAGVQRGLDGVGANFLMSYADHAGKESLDHLANMAKKMGWAKPSHFKEMYEGMKRVGWDNIGREVAVLDDIQGSKIFTSSFGKVVDAGTGFFNVGEKFARRVAWGAAYREWREVNPSAVFNDRAIKSVLDRSDDLTVNMTAASKASWQKGFAAIPTQFWSYNIRLMEQFSSGKAITPAIRARALATYSVMYGVPIGIGVPIAGLWPVSESIKEGLLRNDIEFDDPILDALNDGLLGTVSSMITGEEHSIGASLGPRGNPFVKEMIEGLNGENNKDWFDFLSGVSGTGINNFLYSLSPFIDMSFQVFNPNSEKLKLTDQHWADFFNNISSAKQFNRTYDAITYGKFLSKFGTEDRDMTIIDGVMLGLTGALPERIQDMYTKRNVNKEMSVNKRKHQQEAVKYYKKAFEADSDEARANNFRWAHMHMKGSRPDEAQRVFSRAIRGMGPSIRREDDKFNNMNEERHSLWLNKIYKKQEGDK